MLFYALLVQLRLYFCLSFSFPPVFSFDRSSDFFEASHARTEIIQGRVNIADIDRKPSSSGASDNVVICYDLMAMT